MFRKDWEVYSLRHTHNQDSVSSPNNYIYSNTTILQKINKYLTKVNNLLNHECGLHFIFVILSVSWVTLKSFGRLQPMIVITLAATAEPTATQSLSL